MNWTKTKPTNDKAQQKSKNIRTIVIKKLIRCLENALIFGKINVGPSILPCQ